MDVNKNNIGVGQSQTIDGVDGTKSDYQNLSIADQTMFVMLERSEVLETQIRDQIAVVQKKNDQLKQLADIEAKLRDMQNNTEAVNESTWTVDTSANPKEISLDNGYSILIHGEDEAWTIKDANGKETKIWGDPHVNEGDSDGNKNWDFQEDAAFVLPDGTKIHVGTIDLKDRGDDKTVFTDKLTITKGNQSIEVSNIANNDPQIGEPELSGGALDAATNDGHVFIMGDEADDWVYHQSGSDEHIGASGWTNVTDDAGAINYEHSMGATDDSNINTVLSQDDINLLSELGIEVFDNSGTGYLSPTEINNTLMSIKSQKDTLTSMSQLDMVKLQSYNSKYEQTNAMSSQVMKSQYAQAKEIIRNI